MNQKKYEIVFGAVAIALLMVSSATAVIVPQTQQTQIKTVPAVDQGSTVQNDVYVDPKIYLTGDDLPGLREMLGETDDQETRELVEQTISVIESKGFVNSNDIKGFLKPGSGVIGVYSGWISGVSGGWAKIPLGLKFIWPFGEYITIFYACFLPHTVKWNATREGDADVDIKIGDDVHLTTLHKGIATWFYPGDVFQCIRYEAGKSVGVFQIDGESKFIVITDTTTSKISLTSSR